MRHISDWTYSCHGWPWDIDSTTLVEEKHFFDLFLHLIFNCM